MSAAHGIPWRCRGHRGWTLNNRLQGVACYPGRNSDSLRLGVSSVQWPIPNDEAGARACLDAVLARDTLTLRAMMLQHGHDLGLNDAVTRWENLETANPAPPAPRTDETEHMPILPVQASQQTGPTADDLARRLADALATIKAQESAARVPAAPVGLDPMMQMMIMKMQQDEAARARTGQMLMQLAAAVLPALLPALINRPQQGGMIEDQMKGLLAMQQAQAQTAMTMLAETFASSQRIKDSVTEQMMARALDRSDAGNEKSQGGIAGVIREVRLGLAMVASDAQRAAPGLAPQGLSLPPDVAADDFDVIGAGEDEEDEDDAEEAETAAPIAAPAPAPTAPATAAKPTAAGLVLSALKKVWEADDEAGDTTSLNAQLAGVIATDRALKAAVVSGDDVQLFTACAPVVTAMPGMLEWLGMEGVEEWLTSYVVERLRPLLLPRMRVVDDPTAAPVKPAAAAAKPVRKAL